MDHATTTTNFRSQRVVFIRHGVAQHNMVGTSTSQLQGEELWDTNLVIEGKHQAVAAGEAVSNYFKPELVVVSPLTRCLQTATLAFPPGRESYGSKPIQFVCKELTREAYGVHYPDKRRNRSELERHWKSVTFEEEMTEMDTWWKPDQRERWDELQNRTLRFMYWLKDRPEQNIVVVTHGVWMECLLHTGLKGRRVYNTDAYACNLKSSLNGSISAPVEIADVVQIHGLMR